MKIERTTIILTQAELDKLSKLSNEMQEDISYYMDEAKQEAGTPKEQWMAFNEREDEIREILTDENKQDFLSVIHTIKDIPSRKVLTSLFGEYEEDGNIYNKDLPQELDEFLYDYKSDTVESRAITSHKVITKALHMEQTQEPRLQRAF